MRDAALHQWLLASGTSEVGVGGDLRTSIAALEIAETDFKLHKSCTTLSYGEHADGILITARRSPASASGDQVLALIRKEDYTLKQTGEWDVLGMRGTCSPPFEVAAAASTRQILPEPFRDIAIQTMIPYSHILWSAVWLGIAADAVATAQSHLKQTARKTPKVMPLAAPGLVVSLNHFQQLSVNVRAAAGEYDRLSADPATAATLGTSAYALRINNLKLTSFPHRRANLPGMSPGLRPRRLRQQFPLQPRPPASRRPFRPADDLQQPHQPDQRRPPPHRRRRSPR